MSIDLRSVLAFGNALQRATGLRDLIEVAHSGVREQTRFRNVWLAVFEPADPAHVYIVQATGDAPDILLKDCPRIPIAGDAMIAEMLEGRAPVIVREAIDDPRTNKAMVAAFGSRTIINVPMLLGPTLVGSLGVGTFGDEGVLDATELEIEHLVIFASLLAGTVSRLHLMEQQRVDAGRRRELEASLEAMQRVDLMGVLAAGVAHDLNNYLAVVRGSLDLLSLDDDTQRPLVEEALFATDKAASVTRQLLALGQRSGDVPTRLDLGAVVEGTMRLVRPAIPRTVELVVSPAHTIAVRAHAVQVEQAVANLVINARDAVGASGRIAVDVESADVAGDEPGSGAIARPGRYGRVRVRDSGPGIGPEEIARIFDPLYSTKRGGTGLGLAVVSRVAEQHGGFVRCDSTRGEGSTFSLFLPADV